MKLDLLVISCILSLLIINSGCKKTTTQTATTAQCMIDSTKFKDFTWNHLTGALATLQFSSAGIYYENSTNDGNWILSNSCDSVYVTRPSNNFYYKIISVTNDTLKLENPAFGQLTYYK